MMSLTESTECDPRTASGRRAIGSQAAMLGRELKTPSGSSLLARFGRGPSSR